MKATLSPSTPISAEGSCYRRFGNRCIGGYQFGHLSDCDGDCTTTLVEEDRVLFEAYSREFPITIIRGTLHEVESEAPLSGLPVKVLLPTGHIVSTTTDASGFFSVSVETFDSLKARYVPNVYDMGDVPFSTNPPDSEPQSYFLVVVSRPTGKCCS